MRRVILSMSATPFLLPFDNLVLRSLPIDPVVNDESRTVPGAIFSRVPLAPLSHPTTVCVSKPAMDLIGVDPLHYTHPDFPLYFSGSRLLAGSEPAAHCYCGYQFGVFAGQLGDGAAKYLGEVVDAAGARWEMQIKGAGPTPYSRNNDGRKVLRSSIREFLCSEAMHHLNIPTTRAGCLITSDSRVPRDMFYTGRNIPEKCSTVLRIAPTFLRFGSFEIANPRDRSSGQSGPSEKQPLVVKELLDFTIRTYYPEIHAQYATQPEEACFHFFNEVCLRTARLVAQWQSVGFCHGVLNTDNMSIVGLTIDYGPYGFMESFNPNHICNHSDHSGRYTYDAQPRICRWNLGRLAIALQPFLPMSRSSAVLDQYYQQYEACLSDIVRRKLGILFTQEPQDILLWKSLLDTMHATGVDFTRTLRLMRKIHQDDHFLEAIMEMTSSLDDQIEMLRPVLSDSDFAVVLPIFKQSPQSMEMFGLSEVLVKSEIEKREKITALKAMSEDYFHTSLRAQWEKFLQDYHARIQRDGPSSSPLPLTSDLPTLRVQRMNESNPAFVLRNHLLQSAIEQAEKGDFGGVEHLLQRATAPFDEQADDFLPSPDWAADVCVSCSS